MRRLSKTCQLLQFQTYRTEKGQHERIRIKIFWDNITAATKQMRVTMHIVLKDILQELNYVQYVKENVTFRRNEQPSAPRNS